MEDRSRQTSRKPKRLRGHPQTLGRRAHHRVDQPLPTPRQGLRKPQPNRRRLHSSGQHPAHAPKAHEILLSIMNFPDGLLGVLSTGAAMAMSIGLA